MEILEWIEAHAELLAILGTLGLLMLIGSALVIPLIIAYMPEDYFVRINRGPLLRKPHRQVLHALKNILGYLLILCGILLLLLPGQGILTIIIGISLIDFPGKRRLQVRLVQVESVRKSMQWIRRKSHRQPLIIPMRGSH